MNEGTEMSTAIATTGRGELVSTRAKITADALAEAGEQRKLLGEYVAKHMIAGVDYGAIPGTDQNKKTLLKPGAEKLTELFRCTPKFTQTAKVEDWEHGFFHYEFKCVIELRDTEMSLAEGVGSCNSRESRYRWRNGKRVCPSCGKDSINRSKFPPRNNPSAEPGWYCHAKSGGCGANFDAKDQSITGQETGRVENPDIADCVNTILKIAKKRALVDAAIALARCSDIFTQDMDDFSEPSEPLHAAPAIDQAVNNAVQKQKGSVPQDRDEIEQQVFDCLTEIGDITGDGFDKSYWKAMNYYKWDYASLADIPYGQLCRIREAVATKVEAMRVVVGKKETEPAAV